MIDKGAYGEFPRGWGGLVILKVLDKDECGVDKLRPKGVITFMTLHPHRQVAATLF